MALIWSEIRMGQYRDDDHKEQAPGFIIFVSRSVIQGTYKIAVVHGPIHIMVLSHCQHSFEMSYRGYGLDPFFRFFFNKFLINSRFLIRIICSQPTNSLWTTLFMSKAGSEKNWNETRFVSREKRSKLINSDFNWIELAKKAYMSIRLS